MRVASELFKDLTRPLYWRPGIHNPFPRPKLLQQRKESAGQVLGGLLALLVFPAMTTGWYRVTLPQPQFLPSRFTADHLLRDKYCNRAFPGMKK